MLYNQLSPEAQQRAHNWYREHCLDYDWWDFTCDDWENQLAEKGFTDAEIHFSGFGRQGDGACFSAGVNREYKLPSELQTQLGEAIALARIQARFDGRHLTEGDIHAQFAWEVCPSIKRDIHSHYSHSNTMHADLSLTYGDGLPAHLQRRLEQWASELEQALTCEVRALADDIYRALESEWDYLNEDDTVGEAITANEHEFDKDGDFTPNPRRQRRQLAAA